MALQTATFGAGCFWGVEAAFVELPGVHETTVGYAGGTTDAPTYETICSGATNHAEVVQITFDPTRTTYDTLLNLFWQLHDPTTLNRQGPDVGTQYRSVIFTHDEAQHAAATAARDALAASGTFADPIVTEITPAPPFHRAEEYHQQYLAKQGQPSCHRPR